MRKLLNTLYITTENSYATLDGENIVVKVEDTVKGRFPLHILESIYFFSYAGASPALIGKCVDQNIDIVFATPSGKFLARPTGRTKGNVLLRREQYRIADDENRKLMIAKNFIIGKLVNEKRVLDRMVRDHADRVNRKEFSDSSASILSIAKAAQVVEDTESLRGLEGRAAVIYFSHFSDMVLRNKTDFLFSKRTRRPPLDNINALLSYVYMMLSSMCASALEAVGLDPYVGFMHTDRAGRVSLALDLVEELRPCLADRFVLSLINTGKITADDFEKQSSGAVLINAEGKKKIQQMWQNRKQEQLIHPYLKEKVEWGLVPYIQAMLLARYIREDIDGYPPFVWR